MHAAAALPPTAGALPTWASLAGFGDVLQIVAGVLLSLAGLGLVLAGLVGVADRAWRRGLVGLLAGAALTALGLWMVGVLAG